MLTLLKIESSTRRDRAISNQISEEVWSLIHKSSLIDGWEPGMGDEEKAYLVIRFGVIRHIRERLAEIFRVNLLCRFFSAPHFPDEENAN